MTNKKIIEEFIEKGADLEHDRWARWQKYMFSKCEVALNDDLIVPKELVKRWFRQIDTKYADLSEEEKESDRKETRNYLPLLEQALATQKQEIKETLEKEFVKRLPAFPPKETKNIPLVFTLKEAKKIIKDL